MDAVRPDEQGLVVEAVSKRFGAVEVLRGVSLNVAAGEAAGEFVTLLGPSGCGKTTLMRIVAGLETADAGTVRLAGQPLAWPGGGVPAHRRPVNMVFQSYALFPHLTVEGNVLFGLRARGVPQAAAKAKAADALDMLRIADLAARRPHQLSGGQRQRVALARAIVNEPAVLLLDEPMSALDAKLRTEVQAELRRLQRKLASTFVLVTHDQDEALSLSDRLFLMNAGRIEQEGPPAAVYERPATRFAATFLGSGGGANVWDAQRLSPHRVRTIVGDLDLAEEVPWPTGWVAVRPERVRVEPGDGYTIDDATYRGDHWEFTAAAGTGGHQVRAKLPAGREVRVGSRVRLSFPPEFVVPLAG